MTGKPIKQGMLVQQLEINFSEETKKFLMEALKAEPVKHGEWENHGNRWLTCSLCDWECAFHYNYCPQCGAKMDKE